MLNFNQLRIFYHAAKNLSFTATVGDPTLFLDVSIAYLENQKLSPPAGAFLENLSNLSGGDMPALGIGALMAKIRAHRDELTAT